MTIFYLVLILIISFLSVTTSYHPRNPHFRKPSCYMINMGDSNTDTGTGCALSGMLTQPPPPVVLFEGQNMNCRTSNGRVYIDFLCENLGIKYLSPYLESVGSDFSNGVNFAISHASVDDSNNSSIPLGLQVMQFKHFVNRTKRFTPGGAKFEKKLRNAIFSIDIGQNDLAANTALDRQLIIHHLIPNLTDKIGTAVKSLYDAGGRKFVVYNTGPLGCLPWNVIFNVGGGPRDRIGCMSNFNGIAGAFNQRLKSMCDKLRAELKDAMVMYADIYSVKYDLFADPSKYGFVNPFVQCYFPFTSTVCDDPSRVVSWDGIHYTDAASNVVGRKIWSEVFFQPYNITFSNLC